MLAETSNPLDALCWRMRSLADLAKHKEPAISEALIDGVIQIERLTRELAEEKKLSVAISRDCNAVALERNSHWSALGQMTRERDRLQVELSSKMEVGKEMERYRSGLVRAHARLSNGEIWPTLQGLCDMLGMPVPKELPEALSQIMVMRQAKTAAEIERLQGELDSYEGPRIPELLKENTEFTHRIVALEAERDRLTRQRDGYRDAVGRLNAKADRIADERDAAERKLGMAHVRIEGMGAEIERLQGELGDTTWQDHADRWQKEARRLRAALERIAKDPDFGASLVGPAHGAGMYTGWIIARDIARAALVGTSEPKEAAVIDPNIIGDDGPLTVEQCIAWLEAKHRRHGEAEDLAAAKWLRKLALPPAAQDEATAAPEGVSEPASFTCKCGKHKLLYSFAMVFEREGEAPHTAGSCPISLESDINRRASSKQLDIRKSEAAAAPEGISKAELPGGAVPVVKPQGTGETGNDRPAAPDSIDALVSRFLAWPLPKSVCSDLCVTHPDYEFPRSGTNLLTADEARQMIEYLLAPAPNAHHPGPRCGCRECKGEFG